MGEFEPVIGLEVHAQLKTRTKIFCGCRNEFNAAPNSAVCPVCLGLPGSLPVLNAAVVRLALRASVALNCTVHSRSIFARKNYFYPDLPKGYQISQFDQPIATGGHVELLSRSGELRRIGITRLHMEEDAGKNVHEGDESLVDLNRAGIPLIEIVSEPDIRSPEEAAAYMKELRTILRFIDACDGNLEEGSLRCDANVSVRPKGSDRLGTKVEIKNINSFRFVEKAITYEIERQKSLVASGGTIQAETRLFDADRGITQSMRTKEDAQDYRYFPDPDLIPVIIDEELLRSARSSLPTLPAELRARFQSTYGLGIDEAMLFSQSLLLSEFYEQTVASGAEAKAASNWIQTELLRVIKDPETDIATLKITPATLAALLKRVADGTISGKIAKELFATMLETGETVDALIDKSGARQISDPAALIPIIDQLLAAHPKEAEQVRSGNARILGFFVGQLMKATQGKANPELANRLLRERLG